MSEDRCKEVLGEPDKRYLTDKNCKRLQFNSSMLELSFEPSNELRLGWIEVRSSVARLNGTEIIGMSQQEACDIANYLFGEKPISEDYGSFISTTYEDHWVELQFEFGLLRSINLGVLFDENDDPVWPDL